MEYLLRDIDPQVWATVKEQAKADNITVKEAILALSASYARREVRVITTPPADAERT